ncbi:TonB-dependent receptor [Rugamonas apoptosis]|uniref:TonB-dependent receptor n=1 Tax=Rugamonas apoptosis TaxID=2758570 RepID=A0A7W2FAY2_9BURK|nr:TonB-dependent receptor [Rugamonas apoptosis]MBA5688274.1 TonB-dependent receptor [Rugamonas apoptosis]
MMIETIISRSLRQMFSGTAVVVGLGVLAQPVMAQEAPIQRVEITGSAIKRIDAETAVPVTVVKMTDLKKQGITTVEQVLANLSVSQANQGTSQVVGSGTGGASFADLRGIGADKTLILLNGRRLANNAFDSSAPDLNMIPFAALERVEVLRDGASSLYGSDAVGGVINFITRKDFRGGSVTVGADSPQHAGGFANNFNVGYGYGDLDQQGFNVFAVVDHQEQHRIGGTQRPFNTRYFGGVSTSTSPGNYYQDGNSANPAGPTCANGLFTAPAADGSCKMTTSRFVDYVPKSERTTALVKGTLKLNENHELGIELLSTQSKVQSAIAPVPYGGLFMNRLRPDGSVNPYYPTSGTITLDPNYTEDPMPRGTQPGFIHVKWRDVPNGPRADENINNQQRLVVSLTGNLAGWDYDAAMTYNENKVKENLRGYSDGGIIRAGVLNGVINPFGDQSAAGNALLASAALDGNVQNAKGTTAGADFHASREVGDWTHSGRQAALAVGAQAQHEKFQQVANADYAAKVVSSTGIDPETNNQGSRNVYAMFAELNVPVLANLDITGALRFDKYSDFGHTTNPKFSFRYQPSKQVLLRGSASRGFRAPSLYEINNPQTYTSGENTLNDPVNCPGGKPIAGKSAAANCGQQFETLLGGNKNLSPEKSKSLSLGILVEPVNNLTLGVDYWSIQLTHQISTLKDSTVLDPTAPAVFGPYIHRNPAGNLAIDGSQCPDPATCGYLDLRTQNLGDLNTNGLDLSATYKMRTAEFGTYQFAMNATYVHKYEYQNYIGDVMHQNVNVYADDGSNIFRWQNTMSLTWNSGKFGAGLAAHYKTGYIDFKPTNTVSSYTTFDGYGSWEAFKNFSLTAGVRNLFDRDPPLSFQTGKFQAGYDPRYSDPTGRTYYVRGTYNF